MNSGKKSLRRTSFLLATMLAGAGLLGAADDATSQNDEIAKLKAALAAQQQQLQTLQKAIQQQQQVLEKATAALAATAAQPAGRLPAQSAAQTASAPALRQAGWEMWPA